MRESNFSEWTADDVKRALAEWVPSQFYAIELEIAVTQALLEAFTSGALKPHPIAQ